MAAPTGDVPERLKAPCNTCGPGRNHLVLHREETHWDDDLGHGNHIWGSDTYLLIRCAGCDAVHLRHESTFSEDQSDEPSVRYYPPTISRRKPSWVGTLAWYMGDTVEHGIMQVLGEVYVALQNGSRRLAAMGIRAALELVMIDKIGGDKGSIGSNVSAFIAAGFVPPHFESLFRDTMMEAGNAAMHRNYQPSKEHLDVLMDLTEWLVVSIYEHPVRAAKVTAAIPPRREGKRP